MRTALIALVLMFSGLQAHAYESQVNSSCAFWSGDCTTVVKINGACVKFVGAKSAEFNGALFDMNFSHVITVNMKTIGRVKFNWDRKGWIVTPDLAAKLHGVARVCSAND